MGRIHFPPDSFLPGTNELFPYYMVADEAFPLKKWIMRPYPGQSPTFKERIFNYRLSRARRIVENAFGILAYRWRIFRRQIETTPTHAIKLVKACLALHNYLRTNDTLEPSSTRYIPPTYCDRESGGVFHAGEWREISGSTL